MAALLVAPLLLLWLLPALLVARLASHDGLTGWLFLMVALVIGWPVPLVFVLVRREYVPPSHPAPRG
jgi:hypothetical protein